MLKGMRDFQIPTKVEVDKESVTATYGRFTAEPFERGFGTTVGNSLRRVLLSSLSGAAVVSVKIEGVLHEFSTIPGITEDVTDIILNVKKIRFKLHADKTKTLRLRKKGPGVAKAGDVEHDADIEILTPDLHIATLDKSAVLDMEIVVKHGRGYVSAERNKEEGMPIGVIPVDAFYSPVTRVNYLVENARVGRMTDYDKLLLEVWTDGSVSPEDALSSAALIVRGHLDIFIKVKDMEEALAQPVAQETITEITPMGIPSSLFRSAETYPRPCLTTISMSSRAPLSRVAMCRSGVRISTSASCSTSPAFATPGPFLRRRMVLVFSACSLKRIFLTLRMMSVTSSVMPGIVENSCRTPSILTETTAAPDNEDSNTRRNELPTVVPNPRSNGSAVNRPYVAVMDSLSTSTFVGI